MGNKLVTWIIQRGKEGEYSSFRQLAKKADLSHSHVAKILNEEREVSWDFCVKMAKVFDQPVLTFFVMGGLIPNIPDEIKKDEQKRVLLNIFDTLSQEAQKEVIEFAKFKSQLPP